MDTKARDLAAAFKKAAKDSVVERAFREAVEKYLIELAEGEDIDLTPHTEVTLGTGRADTIYSRQARQRNAQLRDGFGKVHCAGKGVA